jgi:hypothetical protein
MKPYIYSILFFLIIQSTYSQSTELILNDSYDVDENFTLNLDVDNTVIIFEESKDNKVYINYTILFEKNSEEIQYRVFKGINAKSYKTKNKIQLDVKNTMFLGELYYINVDLESYKENIRDFFKKRKDNEFYYKSKDSIIKEIRFSEGTDTNDYFKKLKLENPNYYRKSPQKFRQKLIVKVPKNLKIKIKALHSKIDFTYNINALLDISSFKTYYKFKNINNEKNKFKLMNGIFQAEKIYGGDYEFKDIRKVRIGSIEKVILKTETSRIQLGEIKENVVFTDYDSKIHLYNFNNTFKDFSFKGEYTKLGLYKVKEANYTMDVFGYNTVLKMDNNSTSFGDAKEKKLTKILQKKPKENVKPGGNIAIELKNGILNIN